MPSTGSGTFATSTVTTALTAATKAKGGAAESTAAGLTVATTTVKRISGRLSLAIEDIAAIGVGNFESSLRENLSLTGIFKRLTDPTDPTAVVDWDAFNAAYADAVDGLWAATCKQVRMLVGVDTYRKSVKSFRDRVIDTGNRGAASLGAMSWADYANAHTGGWSTNKRMPAAASNVQAAVAYRTGRSVQTAVLPIFDRLTIDDPYTSSASGERHYTAHILCGDVILTQPDAYSEVRFKVA